MENNVCDFIPQPDGWAVLINGRWMASYPSLYLAVNAVETGRFDRANDAKRLVMRSLDAGGNLRDLTAQGQPGFGH